MSKFGRAWGWRMLALHRVVHPHQEFPYSSIQILTPEKLLSPSPAGLQGTLAVIEGSLLVGFGYAFKFTLVRGQGAASPHARGGSSTAPFTPTPKA